jgi:hypothetical protein
MLDKTNGEGNWRIVFNVDTTASVSIPTYFSQLGENDATLRDYRLAKHYLGLQERATRINELRRHHFYLITVVHNEKKAYPYLYGQKHPHSDEKRLPHE